MKPHSFTRMWLCVGSVLLLGAGSWCLTGWPIYFTTALNGVPGLLRLDITDERWVRAMDAIREEIGKNFGDRYLQVRRYKNKNESAQEAHEAIRPTYIENATIEDADAKRLYELIWKRTMASQMADAELERTIAKINISTNNNELTAEGEVLKFDGFLKVYNEGRDDEEDGEKAEGMLPPLSAGDILAFNEMKAIEKFTRPAPRYTEASLVKKLEDLGIGRPSTYAPTISTILKRNYVEKRDKEGVKRNFRILVLRNDNISKLTDQENTGAEKAKLFPTDLGLVVTDFLNQYFSARHQIRSSISEIEKQRT